MFWFFMLSDFCSSNQCLLSVYYVLCSVLGPASEKTRRRLCLVMVTTECATDRGLCKIQGHLLSRGFVQFGERLISLSQQVFPKLFFFFLRIHQVCCLWMYVKYFLLVFYLSCLGRNKYSVRLLALKVQWATGGIVLFANGEIINNVAHKGNDDFIMYKGKTIGMDLNRMC